MYFNTFLSFFYFVVLKMDYIFVIVIIWITQSTITVAKNI